MLSEEKGITFLMPKLLVQPKDPKTYALFILASDKGLCGSYNTMIAREAKRRIDELTKAGRAQEEYQKQVSDELRKGTSNENNTTKDIKDMLPSKNQYVIDDDKARDAAIKARKKTLEAEKNEQINK